MRCISRKQKVPLRAGHRYSRDFFVRDVRMDGMAGNFVDFVLSVCVELTAQQLQSRLVLM